MKFNDMLEDYISCRIDADMLRNQIKKLSNEYLFEYKFRELEYLKIYPFISILYDEDIYEDEHILKNEVKRIIDILDGKTPFTYDLWMKLEVHEISHIFKIWDGYRKNGRILFEESKLLKKELHELSFNTKTIEDICLEKLLTLLIGLPITNSKEFMYNLLYTDEEINEAGVIEEAERLINILAGKSPVHILLKYVCKDCMYIIL